MTPDKVKELIDILEHPTEFKIKYRDEALKTVISILKQVLEGKLVEPMEELKADEVTLEFFRKYLKMPNATLEELCRKCDALTGKVGKGRE